MAATASARASPSTLPVLLTEKLRPLMRMALPTEAAAVSMAWPAWTRSCNVTIRVLDTW